MATLHEYFYKDFPYTISFHKTCSTSYNNKAITFFVRLLADYQTNSKFFAFYFEPLEEEIAVFEQVLNNIENFFQLVNDFSVQDIFGSESIEGDWLSLREDLRFTGRVVFYYNSVINRKSLIELQKNYKNKGLIVQCFDAALATRRNDKQKPLAFISHDSRDKDFARELAIGLEKRMCTVWFDEFTLKVGDSLRESIEKGLLECKKCVLVLSPNFLTNKGWTKTEFNTIFTREIVETKKLVLPVWLNVNADDVFYYSPTLRDRVGVSSDKGIDFVIDKLHQAIISDS